MRLTTTKKKEPELFDSLESINENEYFIKFQTDEPTTWQCVADKLGQLEDIEEELGIDLLTYFKIKSAERVYVKELGSDISEMLVRPSKDSIDVCYKGFVNIPECDSSLQLKDYGKTWALTKEELL